ncbi:hypothetical protein QCA50_003808 [Cerrena zonata]|uniref:Uncharacterized protein n=1 Tax=Cerrena zonata TaxID=2478898 RepID=A0AAW0GSG3_9APHY
MSQVQTAEYVFKSVQNTLKQSDHIESHRLLHEWDSIKKKYYDYKPSYDVAVLECKRFLRDNKVPAKAIDRAMDTFVKGADKHAKALVNAAAPFVRLLQNWRDFCCRFREIRTETNTEYSAFLGMLGLGDIFNLNKILASTVVIWCREFLQAVFIRTNTPEDRMKESLDPPIYQCIAIFEGVQLACDYVKFVISHNDHIISQRGLAALALPDNTRRELSKAGTYLTPMLQEYDICIKRCHQMCECP